MQLLYLRKNSYKSIFYYVDSDSRFRNTTFFVLIYRYLLTYTGIYCNMNRYGCFFYRNFGQLTAVLRILIPTGSVFYIYLFGSGSVFGIRIRIRIGEMVGSGPFIYYAEPILWLTFYFRQI